jgi:hypothetical protein
MVNRSQNLLLLLPRSPPPPPARDIPSERDLLELRPWPLHLL